MFQDMEKWVEIRRKVLANEASKRAICREYNIHWDTLQRILTYPEPPKYEQKKPREKPKIGKFVPIIHEILKSDQQVHRKQRHTAKRIFARLRDEHHYEGGYTGVKEAVRAWKAQHKEVFLPLSHPPGEAQVDFGEADVILRGETTRVALFVMTLPYSDAIFCQVFPRECTEAFLEGHKRAFEFFGGVPRRISYDNSKIAVAKITGSRQREVTREFLRLESHYLFEHHFCLVRRPNEKGHVERLLDFARANFLVPVPVTDDLARLNEQLEQSCRNDLDRKLRGKSGPKAQLLVEEQASLLPLPKQSFEARRVTPGRASSLSLVRFDNNDYSVPTAYAHRKITIVAGEAVPAGWKTAPGRGRRRAAPSGGLSVVVGGGLNHVQEREQEHGAVEAPSEGPEDADHAGRVREGGGALRQGERGPSGVPAPTVRIGTVGSRTAGRRASAQSGEVPVAQDPGYVRLQGAALD